MLIIIIEEAHKVVEGICLWLESDIYLLSQRYELSLNDLRQLGWQLSFPPTAEMFLWNSGVRPWTYAYLLNI